MIKRREFCKYCKKKIETGNAKKQYCTDTCKTYYYLEKKRGTLPEQKKNLKEQLDSVDIPKPSKGYSGSDIVLNPYEEKEVLNIPSEIEYEIEKRMRSFSRIVTAQFEEQKRLRQYYNTYNKLP